MFRNCAALMVKGSSWFAFGHRGVEACTYTLLGMYVDARRRIEVQYGKKRVVALTGAWSCSVSSGEG